MSTYEPQVGSLNVFVPSLLLSNVMSSAPKIDEVRSVAAEVNLDIICIVESWLQTHIHDNIVHIEITSSDNWKYVDDTTISEYVNKGEMSNIQSEVDEFTAQAQANKFQFNEGKCKELRIGFSSKPTQFDPISINDKSLEPCKDSWFTCL